MSLYAATKRSCELLGQSYARLYGFPQSGLRFFTVYGPWGRPDMASLEAALGIEARKVFLPMQPGDVPATFANIDKLRALCGYQPKVKLAEGLARFVEWLKACRLAKY